ncbi:Trans-aconitate 2-methyltransferase [Diplonema papillatum]|nr:Trans-aconitate 2-methyltransferase [Diplonema papillatum]|eukprot:gene8953-13862_t
MSSAYIRETMRLRPAKDLLSRVAKRSMNPRVVHLGCGDGYVIPVLRQHWPGAQLLCVGENRQKLQEAMTNSIDSSVSFEHSSIEDWKPREERKVDVIFVNSVLHVVESHVELLSKLFSMLPQGGVLAVQMPIFQGSTYLNLMNEAANESGCKSLPYQMTVHPVEKYYQTLAPISSTFETWTSEHHFFTPPSNVAPLLSATGSLWHRYLAAVGKQNEAKFLDIFSQKVKSEMPVIDPSTNECRVTVKRFYMVATKEGHGPTMGLRFA